MTKPRGRPSKFTQALADEIAARLSKGEPLTVICSDAHMPEDRTVRRWQEVDAEFASDIADARARGFDAIAAECIAIAEDGSRDYAPRENADGTTYEAFNSEHVQRSKLRIETRLKLLAKWDPRRYGERTQTELTGPNGGPLSVEATVTFIRPGDGRAST